MQVKRVQVSTGETWANNREGERECEIDESNSTSLGVAMSEKGKRNGGRDIRFLSDTDPADIGGTGKT